jgi:hypothetical protein
VFAEEIETTGVRDFGFCEQREISVFAARRATIKFRVKLLIDAKQSPILRCLSSCGAIIASIKENVCEEADISSNDPLRQAS